MHTIFKSAVTAATLIFCAQAGAEVVLYEREAFEGRYYTAVGQIPNLDSGQNIAGASSAVVVSGEWQVCESERFGGKCMVLRPGNYPSPAAMGLSYRVSSVRAISGRLPEHRYAPGSNVEAKRAVAPLITFYENEGFKGQSFDTTKPVGNFERAGFNNRASSVVVIGQRWEVCEDPGYGGRCMVLRQGRYPSLNSMGLNDRASSVRFVTGSERIDDSRYAPAPPPLHAPGSNVEAKGAVAPLITFYENEGFKGQSFDTTKPVGNFERAGFNNRASSVVVIGQRWEVCENPAYGGRCMVLRQGRYPSLDAMGLNDRVSSVRLVTGNARIDDSRYAPAPLPVYDNRRRRNERIYEAKVLSVRAVVGTPEQRCWVEKEAMPQNQNSLSVPGTLIGAVIGGVLGHQIGSGSGNTAATIGGVVAGGAVGSQVGRLGIGGQPQQTRDVQRCDTVASDAKPDHWDVTYDFRGQEHRIQTTTQPGSTITVNERGEPRA